MNAHSGAPDVNISFTQDEALVLFERLSGFNDSQPTFAYQAEQRVLWDVEAMLERSLDALFKGNYQALLAAATDRVRDATD